MSLYYDPDIQYRISKATQISFLDASYFAPEPEERILFLLGIILFPIHYLVLKVVTVRLRLVKAFAEHHSLAINISVWLILILTLAILLSKSSVKGLNFAEFYILPAYQGHIVPVGIISFFLMVFYWRNPGAFHEKYTWAIFLIILAIAIFGLLRFSILDGYPTYQNQHFNAVFYSQYHVLQGHALLTDGFNNTYGLYPHFLAPVFHITGITVTGFKIAMSILILFTLGFVFLFLRSLLKDTFFSLLGVTCILFFCFFYRVDFADDLYFQYFPIRIIFPAIFLFASTRYFGNRTRSGFILISLVSSAAILWQPDSGIIVFLSWLILLGYDRFSFSKPVKSLLKIILPGSMAIIVLISTGLIYILCIRIFYTRTPDLGSLFFMIKLFSELGFYMLPMPLWHPWILYVIGSFMLLGFSIEFASRGKKSPGLVSVSLLSLGAMAYYLGRSHDYTFINLYFYAIIMLTVLAKNMMSAGYSKGGRLVKLSGAIIMMFFMSSIPGIVLYSYSYYKNPAFFFPVSDARYSEDISFVKKYVKPEEEILLLTLYHQGEILCSTETQSAFNVAMIDLFLRSDRNRLIETIQASKNKIFISKEMQSDILLYNEVKKNYRIAGTNGRIHYYTPVIQ